MKYVGLHQQQSSNNFKSVLLLCLFPCLVVILTFLFSFLLNWYSTSSYETAEYNSMSVWDMSVLQTIQLLPFVLGGVLIWFLIAYFANTAIIKSATGAKPLERKENMRVYNLVENLCMSKGMQMPQVNILEDDSLNAFASGINNRTYTVTLSRGIINKLNDDELSGVIAHELTHIRNRDVRLLIVSIVFVGIFSMLTQLAFRILANSGRSRSSNNKNSGAAMIIILLILIVVALIGYFFATLMRFAISRKREYMADAGAAEMTRQPQALASALRKISGDPDIESVSRADIAQLFIEHPLKSKKKKSAFSSLFSTHPPIAKRIEVLEQI